MSFTKKVVTVLVIAALMVTWALAEIATIFFAVVAGNFKHERAAEVSCQFMVVAMMLAFLPSFAWFLFKAAAGRFLLDFQSTEDLNRLIEDVNGVIAQRKPPPKVDHRADGILTEESLRHR